MSTTPPPYDRQATFTSFHTEPAPTVGQDLEAEFNAIKQSQDATQSRLQEIQRDDGRLKNDSVHPDALSQATRALLSIDGVIRGLWQTGLVYGVGDVVEGPDGITYLSTVAHVGNPSFAVDLSAGRWISIDSGRPLDAALRADLVSTAAGKGGALVGFKQLGTGAATRTALSKSQDEYSVLDFFTDQSQIAAVRAMATVPVFDCKPAFDAAIAAVPAGGALKIPRGNYYLSAPIAWGDKAISIYGEDRYTTRIWCNNDTGGFAITNTVIPGLDEYSTVKISNLWFLTNNDSGAATFAAISMVAPAPVGDGGQTQQSLIVEDCVFSGIFRFDQWWPYGVYTNNTPNVRVDRCQYQGKANDTKGDAFYFQGKSDVVECINSGALFCNSGFTQESNALDDFGAEALYVIRCGVDDCNFGVRKLHLNATNTGEPLLGVYQTHINSRNIGIQASNVQEVDIDNCSLYLQGTALDPIAAAPRAIYLEDLDTPQSNKKFCITSTHIKQIDVPAGTGIGLLANMSEGIVHGNTFENFNGNAVQIGATYTNVYVSRCNKFINCGVKILNSGAGLTDQPTMVLPALDFGVDQLYTGAGFLATDSVGRLKARATRFTAPDSEGVTVACYGPELLGEGYFDSATGWTLGTGWSITGGNAVHVGPTAGTLGRAISVVAGRRYRVEVVQNAYSAGLCSYGFQGGSDVLIPLPPVLATHVAYLVAASGNFQFSVGTDGAYAATIASISVREVLN